MVDPLKKVSAIAQLLGGAARPLTEGATTEDSVRVEGWVRTRRDSRDFSFIEVNDGSCLANLQIVVEHAGPASATLHDATTGSSVRAEGLLIASEGKGQSIELRAESLQVLNRADEDYPLQKKRHGFEYLRTIGHLRVRTNTFGAVARVRNALFWAIHQFFQERDFLFLPAPIITASDAEGAGEMFQVTTLDPGNIPTANGKPDFSQDFFGQRANLTVSGQLEGEIFAHALKNIYTFGPTFRAENSNTSRHAAEFWMIEPEMGFCALPEALKLAEDFIKNIIGAAREACPEDFAFFDQRIEPGLLKKLDHIQFTAFETISYTEAVNRLIKSGQSFEFEVSWGKDLQSEHERFLTEKSIGKPVFVVDYPAGIKAFYMRVNEDDKTVAAMDLLVPGIGEIIGGSQREERLTVLSARMDAMGFSRQEYWWYLDLRRYGSVPHSGFGLGFERLLMYATGLGNIRDVLPFPRTPGNIAF